MAKRTRRIKNKDTRGNQGKLALLLILLVILAALLVKGGLLGGLKTATVTTTQAHRETVLSFGSVQPASLGATLQIPVRIATGNNKVSAVDITITFPVGSMKNVRVTPGPFFTNPTTLAQEVSESKGTIRYALGSQSPRTGDGVILIISAQVYPPVGGFSLSFNSETAAAAIGEATTVLREAQPGRISLAK